MSQPPPRLQLSSSRCFNHATREAAVCCPACGRFFCRECTNDFEERLLCKSCITALHESVPRTKKKQRLGPVLGLMLGFAISAFTFYCLGQILYSIPSQFHDGTVWHAQETQ